MYRWASIFLKYFLRKLKHCVIDYTSQWYFYLIYKGQYGGLGNKSLSKWSIFIMILLTKTYIFSTHPPTSHNCYGRKVKQRTWREKEWDVQRWKVLFYNRAQDPSNGVFKNYIFKRQWSYSQCHARVRWGEVPLTSSPLMCLSLC